VGTPAAAPEAWLCQFQAWATEGMHAWEAAVGFLECVDTWLDTDPTDVVPALTATLRVLRLAMSVPTAPKIWEWLEEAVGMAALLTIPLCRALELQQRGLKSPQQPHDGQHQGGQQDQQGQQQGQTFLGVPILCTEASALCCSAMCATFEHRWQPFLSSREGQAEEGWISLVRLVSRLSQTIKMASFIHFYLKGSPCAEQGRHLESLLAAAEAAVRLSSWLIDLGPQLEALPGAQRVGLKGTLGSMPGVLIYTCVTVAATLTHISFLQQLPGSTAAAPAVAAVPAVATAWHAAPVVVAVSLPV